MRPPIQTTLPIPRQARSREALERYLEVGEALVASGDFDAAGISEIAKAADSSVGTFYRLVGDKDLLLKAVHDRFVAYGRERIRAALDPARFVDADLAEVLEAFVRVLVEIYAEREGMLRALIVRASTDEAFRVRIGALRGDVRTFLGALLLPRVAQIGHPRPVDAFAFAVKIVVGTLNHTAVVASVEASDPEDLVRELTQVMVSYLEVR